MILRRYLTGLFLRRFVAILLGLAALVQLLDLLDSAGDVLERGAAGGLAFYLAMRLPLILGQILPLAVLLAALTTYLALAQRGEMVIVRAAGVTPLQFLTLLTPIALVIGLGYALASDAILPRAERALVDWWRETMPEEDRAEARAEADPVWMRFRTQIVSADYVEDRGRALSGVTIYPRDTDQRATGRLHATRGVWEDGGWTLFDVEAIGLNDDATEVERRETMRWPGGPAPEDWWQLAVPAEHLSIAELRAQLAGERSGARGPYFYRIALYRAYMLPFLCVTMVLLAMSGTIGSRRGGTVGRGFMLGLGLGLAYVVFGGVTGALGAAGVLSPLLAVWAPTGIFACLAIALYLKFEGA